MEENLEICFWKDVVKNDLEKMASGNGLITLSPEKPCYECDGTKNYANKINCKSHKALGDK